jgi:hypothetical protein
MNIYLKNMKIIIKVTYMFRWIIMIMLKAIIIKLMNIKILISKIIKLIKMFKMLLTLILKINQAHY